MSEQKPPRPNVPEPVSGLGRLRRFTPARIALGRAGSGQTTAASLAFALDHARARDAVHAHVDFGSTATALRERGWEVLIVHSAAPDRSTYLRRPDLGRRLPADAHEALAAHATGGCDVAIVAADGLSAFALEANLQPLLDALRPLLEAAGYGIGPLVLAEQGRVAIGDEIGDLLGARLAVVLIGERPGLSAADSLGVYITFAPRPGTMDSARNCISNIRSGGLPPAEAARQIAATVALAFRHGVSGVRLNDLRGHKDLLT